MKVVFIGTGDIALPSLRWLIGAPDVDLVAVVTGVDRPVGRHQVPTPPRVKEVAAEHGVPVLQPERLGDIVPALAELSPDVIVVMAYGHILRRDLLDLPRLACLNLHASLLPRHRGASPIQGALRAGDPETGVTVMFMSEGLDTGDLLVRRAIPVDPGETGGALHDKLGELAPAALAEALDHLASGTAHRTPQDDDQATYLGKLVREDGRLDWNDDAARLERTIRAFDPWPGTFTHLERPGVATGAPMRVKIFPPTKAVPPGSGEDPDRGVAPGTVLHADTEGIRVATGSGSLVIRELQPDGRRRMSAAEFLAGHPLGPGARLG